MVSILRLASITTIEAALKASANFRICVVSKTWSRVKQERKSGRSDITFEVRK